MRAACLELLTGAALGDATRTAVALARFHGALTGALDLTAAIAIASDVLAVPSTTAVSAA